jgi:hypothetical protein
MSIMGRAGDAALHPSSGHERTGLDLSMHFYT